MYRHLCVLAIPFLFACTTDGKPATSWEQIAEESQALPSTRPLAVPGLWTDSGNEGGLSYRQTFHGLPGKAYHYPLAVDDGKTVVYVRLAVKSRVGYTGEVRLNFVRISNQTGWAELVAESTMVSAKALTVYPAEPIDLEKFSYRLDVSSADGPGTGIDITGAPLLSYAIIPNP